MMPFLVLRCLLISTFLWLSPTLTSGERVIDMRNHDGYSTLFDVDKQRILDSRDTLEELYLCNRGSLVHVDDGLLENLGALRVLDVSGCPLEYIGGLEKMKQLEELHVDANVLVKFHGRHGGFGELNQLKRLYLYYGGDECDEVDIPIVVKEMKKLEMLEIYNSELSVFPEWMKEMKCLTGIGMRKCKELVLSEWMSWRLKELNISMLTLRKMLRSRVNRDDVLMNLECLCIELSACNENGMIDDETYQWIVDLKKLRRLRIHGMPHKIPEIFFECGELEYLDIETNDIELFEKNVLRLKRLKELKVKYEGPDLGENRVGRIKTRGKRRVKQSDMDVVMSVNESVQSVQSKTERLMRILRKITRVFNNDSKKVEKKYVNEEEKTVLLKFHELNELRALELSFCNTNIFLDMNEMCGLKRLVIVKSSISTLPPSIGCMKELEELDLRENKLKELPLEMRHLKKLKKLWLQENCLVRLPLEIGELESLEELWLDKNQSLTSIPQSVFNLERLRILSANTCGLDGDIDLYSINQSLQILDLSHNNNVIILHCHPPSDENLLSLSALLEAINVNSLQDSLIVECLSSMTGRIFLSSLSSIPSGASFSSLQTSDLSKSSSESPSQTTCRQFELRELYLRRTNLDDVPSVIKHMKQLRVLDIGENYIKVIRNDICEATELRELKMDRMNLTEIPLFVFGLKKLETLNMHDNSLNASKFWDGALSGVRILDVSRNCIKEIPLCIMGMKNAIHINFCRNKIVNIPAELLTMVAENRLEFGMKRNVDGVERSLEVGVCSFRIGKTRNLCLNKQEMNESFEIGDSLEVWTRGDKDELLYHYECYSAVKKIK